MSVVTMNDPLKQKTALPTFVWRSVMLAMGMTSTLLVSYFALLSDARNDRRYVQSTEYQNDRQRDREYDSVIHHQIQERLRWQDKKLDEIAADVKSLLRESKGREP